MINTNVPSFFNYYYFHRYHYEYIKQVIHITCSYHKSYYVNYTIFYSFNIHVIRAATQSQITVIDSGPQFINVTRRQLYLPAAIAEFSRPPANLCSLLTLDTHTNTQKNIIMVIYFNKYLFCNFNHMYENYVIIKAQSP